MAECSRQDFARQAHRLDRNKISSASLKVKQTAKNLQENRNNQAVSDLEKSKALNENRSLFRSQFLLDQDQAVRGANLAAIYRDVGLTDISAQEAARAVNHDYGNYSSH